MGEYATRRDNGERIKIGTCESMYYLRHDQRHKVRAESGNVDPVHDAASIRFRFPWPDEDAIEPGNFEDYARKMRVDGLTPSAAVEHDSIQFSAPAGYLVSLPCPEAGTAHITTVARVAGSATALLAQAKSAPLTIHRNGFAGSVFLVEQRYRPGIGLVPVLQCACGAKWRIEERAEIEDLAMRFRAMADRDPQDARARNWHTIADRILDGISDDTRTICDFEQSPQTSSPGTAPTFDHEDADTVSL